MRRMMTTVALLIVASTAAGAACKDEVSSALERQRKTSGFRMVTTMLSQEGIVNMTVDYLLPDRMHQVVSTLADPKPVETILIGKQAWSRQDGPWTLLQSQTADQLAAQMNDTVGGGAAQVGAFECLGKVQVNGKEFLAYQGENAAPDSKEAPSKEPDRAVRIIYVDPTTGLPMRSIFARLNKLDKPIFEANYSYPIDIKVEPPKLDAK